MHHHHWFYYRTHGSTGVGIGGASLAGPDQWFGGVAGCGLRNAAVDVFVPCLRRSLETPCRSEHSLFAKTCDLFNLDTTVTLYDLTNTYFEGEVPNNRKAHRARSKEKRSDCPLVTLGLVLDGSGFVRSSQTFAGNVAEAGTLAAMLTGLNAPPGALVVMDAGIASEANIDWLKSQGYRYLVVSRERSRQF